MKDYRVALRLDKELKKYLIRKAKEEKTTQSQIITTLLLKAKREGF